jgi:hypothetical protein
VAQIRCVDGRAFNDLFCARAVVLTPFTTPVQPAVLE